MQIFCQKAGARKKEGAFRHWNVLDQFYFLFYCSLAITCQAPVLAIGLACPAVYWNPMSISDLFSLSPCCSPVPGNVLITAVVMGLSWQMAKVSLLVLGCFPGQAGTPV